jgi:adenylate kinase family enzyme
LTQLLIVVVTGPPAAGKTTIARGLVEHLGLPLFEKDAIKELLYETIGAGDRDRSREIGFAAFALL